MIYLDNAATSLQKPKEVEEAVVRAFHTMGNPGRGAHEATLQAGRCVYQVREQLAELFHAEKGERIAFTSNATEALNTAILGLFHKGDHVITTVCEHNSVLRPLYRLQEEGVEVSFLSADENGVLEYEKLPELVRENTKGIVITHASNLTGNITDLERIREVTESRDLLLVVDGSQTAGILPVDVQKQGIDIFCFTGHKGLLGPQGTGGLYVRPGVEICPLKVGGSGIHSFDREHPKAMPEHLEAGTMNVHGIAGLGGALDYLKKKGTKEILQRERQLLRRLEEQIREIPGIRIYGDPDGNRRVGILSFNIGEEDSAYVADWLYEEHGIAVRAGAHCAPLMHQTLGTKEQGGCENLCVTLEYGERSGSNGRGFVGVVRNMRMKKKTWILTFESTTQAMAAEKYAMEQNLPGRLIPIPREITAGCGLSWKAVPEARDEILTALEKAGCHWEGEYILEL